MPGPHPIKSHPWDSVVDFFAGFASVNSECEPMHRFVSQVASSRYAKVFFPLTSMHTLILSRTPELEPDREVLRIDFDCTKQRFRFEYVERGPEQPKREGKARTKRCDAAAGFVTFERLLALKNWSV